MRYLLLSASLPLLTLLANNRPGRSTSALRLLSTGAIGAIELVRRKENSRSPICRRWNNGSFFIIAAAAVALLACGPNSLIAQMPDASKLLASEPAISAVSSSTTSTEKGRSTSRVISPANHSITSVRPFSTVGVAVSVSTLGIGGQAAMPLSQKTNLRAEGNFLSYNGATFTYDGIKYSGALKLRSAEMLLDWFPFGGSFHLSPGVQLYSGFNASGNLSVPAGESFTLNDTWYTSSTANPVTGTGKLTTRAAAPMFTLGWGNLVPRREHRRLSIPIDVGFVYQGAPTVALTLAGSACDDLNLHCRDVKTDSGIQSNLAAQQKIASDNARKYFQFYPVISIGFSYKF